MIADALRIHMPAVAVAGHVNCAHYCLSFRVWNFTIYESRMCGAYTYVYNECTKTMATQIRRRLFYDGIPFSGLIVCLSALCVSENREWQRRKMMCDTWSVRLRQKVISQQVHMSLINGNAKQLNFYRPATQLFSILILHFVFDVASGVNRIVGKSLSLSAFNHFYYLTNGRSNQRTTTEYPPNF